MITAARVVRQCLTEAACRMALAPVLESTNGSVLIMGYVVSTSIKAMPCGVLPIKVHLEGDSAPH